MTPPVFLRGDVVELRTLDEDALEFLHEGVNDPGVWVSLGVHGPVHEPESEEWYEEVTSGDDVLQFLVADDGRPVGSVTAFEVNRADGHATLGCWIASDEQGNGYGPDATRTLMRYLFDHQRLHALRATAFAFNDASQRTLEAVGFREVGRLPEWAFVDGEYHDTLVYAVTVDDWLAQ